MGSKIHIRMNEESNPPFNITIISNDGHITEVPLEYEEVLQIENHLRRLRICYEDRTRLHQGYH